MAGIGFIWFWKNDQESWTPYADHHQDAIERARIQGEDHVILQIGPNQTPYLLNFVDMVQENLELGHRRLISRANEFTVWYWKDDDGITWNLYDQEHADTLTRAEAEKEPEVYLVMNETLYRIDLPRRLQIDFDNHHGTENHTREIRQGRPSSAVATTATSQPQQQSNFNNLHSNNRLHNSHNNLRSSLNVDDGPPPVDPDIDPEMERAAPQSFLCPISCHIMKDPVTTSAGSTYDRKYIQWWLIEHDTDPLTKRPIRDKLLVPNNAMKQNIVEWKRDEYLPGVIHPNTNDNNDRKPPATTNTKVMAADFCNDTLKVVFVGQNKTGTSSIVQKLIHHGKDANSNSNSNNVDTTNFKAANPNNSTTTGVNIYDWRPSSSSSGSSNNNKSQIQFFLWDYEGPDSLHSYRSIGFSPQTLYVVVWDMGISNPKVDSSSGSTRQQTSKALEQDIHDKVQFWVDRIKAVVPGAVILPLASFVDLVQSSRTAASVSSPPHRQQQGSSIRQRLSESEAKRRCRILKEKLKAGTATILFDPKQDEDPILRIGGGGSAAASATLGLDAFKQRLLELGGGGRNGSNNSHLFEHIGRSHPEMYRKIRQSVHTMKDQGYKLIDMDMLAVATHDIDRMQMIPALQWLNNIGEVLHFPSLPDAFSQIVILDIGWFYRLAGCILRNDWRAKVSDGRRRTGRDPPPSFGGAVNENCPVMSREDASMLWKNHLATSSDFGCSLSAERFTVTDILKYVQIVMIHNGVLVPVDQDIGPLSSSNMYPSDFATTKARRYLPPSDAARNSQGVASYSSAKLLFIPNLLGRGTHGDGLNDLSFADPATTRLARKMQFIGQAPSCLMEKVIVALLRNITTRLKENEMSDLGRWVRLERLHCWRSLIRIRLSLKKSNSNTNQQEMTVEVCSQLLESVKSDEYGNTGACLFTSANVIKGEGGRCIWEAGYGLVLETIQAVLEGHQGLHFVTSVFCHDCLASRGFHGSHSWPMNELEAAAKDSSKKLKCKGGHIASLHLLDPDAWPDVIPKEEGDLDSKLRQAVVLVGLYDARKRTNKVKRFGSGVVVDAARGLIVTAARNVMNIEGEDRFGQNYDGIIGGKVVIGVIPDDGTDEAVFRYYAKIVSKDPALTDPGSSVCRIDCCVLKITSRFEDDVGGNGDGCCDEIELLLRDNPRKIAAQQLVELPIQAKSNLEDRVRLFGYEQISTSVVNRRMNYVAGYICQKKSSNGSVTDQFKYQPSKTTVVMASARPGHVGGPCLNQQGEVIGILACGDPDEDSRSFVVPVSEWEDLLRRAA